MLLNGTITIKPAPQNANPNATEELVTIEYHGLDGKYLSSTRFTGAISGAVAELLDIICADHLKEDWTREAKDNLRKVGINH